MNIPNQVRLEVEFRRLGKDNLGLVTIRSTGWPYPFAFDDTGLIYHISREEECHVSLTRFCQNMATLVRQQFSNVPSVLSETVKQASHTEVLISDDLMAKEWIT